MLPSTHLKLFFFSVFNCDYLTLGTHQQEHLFLLLFFIYLALCPV